MKVKMDFVSNSSSTSFVYIASEMLTEQSFLEAAGVAPDSPVAGFFSGMYGQLRASIKGGQRLASLDEIDALVGQHDFTPEVLERMKQALQGGNMVVTGTFSSEEGLAESMLCMEIFQIESDQFFINAYDNYW